MKLIDVSTKKHPNTFTMVDDEDYESMKVFLWEFDGRYVYRRNTVGEKRTRIYLHREILKTPIGLDTDHIDRNKLNNVRSNLRICTRSQNNTNSKKRCGSSRFTGVSFDRGKYRVAIKINGKTKHLGRFSSESEAARVRDENAIRYYGEYARLNNA